MKIAVSTVDGISVCGHLGHVSKFLVYEVENNSIVSKSLREVMPVHSGEHGGNEPHDHNHDHNHGGHHDGHGGLVGQVSDCAAVITNGAGGGMIAALAGAGIDPVITPETNPDIAVLAYLQGTLPTGQGCGHCGHH